MVHRTPTSSPPRSGPSGWSGVTPGDYFGCAPASGHHRTAGLPPSITNEAHEGCVALRALQAGQCLFRGLVQVVEGPGPPWCEGCEGGAQEGVFALQGRYCCVGARDRGCCTCDVGGRLVVKLLEEGTAAAQPAGEPLTPQGAVD